MIAPERRTFFKGGGRTQKSHKLEIRASTRLFVRKSGRRRERPIGEEKRATVGKSGPRDKGGERGESKLSDGSGWPSGRGEGRKGHHDDVVARNNLDNELITQRRTGIDR